MTRAKPLQPGAALNLKAARPAPRRYEPYWNYAPYVAGFFGLFGGAFAGLFPVEVSELIAHAAWPELPEDWRDESLDVEFEILQGVISQIRDIRQKNNLPDREELNALIRADGKSGEVLEKNQSLLAHMAFLGEVTVGPDVERTTDSAIRVVKDVDIFIPGAVDLEKERAKLTKQRDQLQGRIGGAQKKLSNEKFIQNAAPEVVERERERVVELEAELAKVESNLAALG